jgi:hypothetical protein
MKTAILITQKGDRIKVYATTEHPDSHYGKEVWVDANGIAYLEVDSKIPNPFYKVEDIKYEKEKR